MCTDNRVLIIKTGFMTGNAFGATLFQLPYRGITSVEVQTGYVTGAFELSSGGVQNAKRGHNNAREVLNAISLHKEHFEKFQAAADFILARVYSADSGGPTPGPGTLSIGDEIAKLAALMEAGHLTSEEFASQKVTILGKSVSPAPVLPAVESDDDRCSESLDAGSS